MKEITLELWNINVKIGDLDDLKENSTIEKGKKIGQRGEDSSISAAKLNGPDQNAINLTNFELSDACKSLLSKAPYFVLAPYNIN